MVVRRASGFGLRWVLAGVGYALLIAAWAFASPLGAAPDEAAHTVRAAAAAVGQLQGRSVMPYDRTPQRTPAQADFLNAEAQQFTIPAGLAPPEPCFAGHADRAASCVGAQPTRRTTGTVTAVTYTTTAPPGAYALAGLAMGLPQQLLPPGYLGRLALALLCGLLLAAAAWAAGARGSLWPLAGLALAASPVVLFLSASLGPQGVTLAAALCFTSALIAFWMGPPRRGLVPLLAVSGAVLALASAAGPVYLAALMLLALPLVQPARLIPLGSLAGLLVVAAAGVAGVAWVLDHRLLPAGHGDVLAAVPVVLRAAPTVAQQAIGVFGWSDVTLPLAAYVAWGSLAVIGVATALLLGRWRDRLALALGVAGAFGVAVVAEAFVLSPVGWDLQGRYLAPVLGALPIVAGFILQRAGVRPRADVFLLGAAVIALQLLAFWENARRYAVGRHGPLAFLDTAQWTPPAGWLPWLGLAGAGGLLILLSLVPLTRAERDQEAHGPLVVVDPISVSR
ncbi:MAG TPA: DUF2142 domain-containing protein [Candidatus Dormibacteraeota bacterium]